MAEFVKTHQGGMALRYEGLKIQEGRDGLLFWRCSLHKTALSLLKDAAMTEGLTLDPSTVICDYELAIIQALSLNNFPNCRSTIKNHPNVNDLCHQILDV